MRTRFLLLLVSAVSAGIAHADIYRYVDSDGAVQFTNVPPDSRYKVYLKEKKTKPDPVAQTLASEIRYYDEGARSRYSRHIYAAARLTKLEPALYTRNFGESDTTRGALSKGAAGLSLMPETRSATGDERLDRGRTFRRRALPARLVPCSNDLHLLSPPTMPARTPWSKYGKKKNRIPYRRQALCTGS